MKIKNILLSTDDNPKFYSFWPTVSYHWQSLGYKVHLAFITNLNENDELVKNIKSYGDTVFLFKPSDKYNIEIQSKLSRFYISKFFPDEISCVLDIDFYTLDNHKHAEEIVTPEILNGNKIATLGYNAYINYSFLNDTTNMNQGVYRFPACPSVATGKKLFSLFSNNINLNFNDFIDNIQQNTQLNLKDIKSDEELILDLNIRRPHWINNNVIYNVREDFMGPNGQYHMWAQQRIDRGKKCNFDIDKLKNGYYIDLCPSRPYNKKEIEFLLDYLKIPKELQNVKL